MRVLLAVLLLLAPPATLAAAGTSSETCDPSGQLVCAWLRVYPGVDCTTDGPRVTCMMTIGWHTTGRSPAQLPGEILHDLEATITRCIDQACAQWTVWEYGACFWEPLERCDDAIAISSPTRVTIDAGECATLTMELAGRAEAGVPYYLPAVGATDLAAPVAASDEVCYAG